MVVFHQFRAYFEKPPKIGHFCLKFGQIKLFFGWETTIFLVFLKNGKSGGKPPVLVVFRKNRKKWWKTTHFDGFFKKPVNRVVFHPNMTIFGAVKHLCLTKAGSFEFKILSFRSCYYVFSFVHIFAHNNVSRSVNWAAKSLRSRILFINTIANTIHVVDNH